MKFSDLGAVTRQDWTLPNQRSSLANPPITLEEARSAPTANCPRHKGLIASQPTQDDAEGRVYLCGVGGQYWRYSKKPRLGNLPRLTYGWRPS